MLAYYCVLNDVFYAAKCELKTERQLLQRGQSGAFHNDAKSIWTFQQYGIPTSMIKTQTSALHQA
jgi:hypothetical protein